jgi:hypothetical protein
MRQLRRIFDIKWQDKVSNNAVLERAQIPSMFTLLKQRRMRWLGHVTRMDDGRIPKDLLYGELAEGKRPRGRPLLRYKDVCKRDMKDLNIDINTWEASAEDRSSWKSLVKEGLTECEESIRHKSEAARLKRRVRREATQQPSSFTCTRCGKDCHANIGLISHSRHCKRH